MTIPPLRQRAFRDTLSTCLEWRRLSVSRLKAQGESRLVPGLLLVSALFTSPSPALAVDPPVQIAQYAHTSWTAREGALLGPVFSMAQTPDGYLWFAGSFGLFRFDGLTFTQWRPPDGQAL